MRKRNIRSASSLRSLFGTCAARAIRLSPRSILEPFAPRAVRSLHTLTFSASACFFLFALTSLSNLHVTSLVSHTFSSISPSSRYTLLPYLFVLTLTENSFFRMHWTIICSTLSLLISFLPSWSLRQRRARRGARNDRGVSRATSEASREGGVVRKCRSEAARTQYSQCFVASLLTAASLT